MDRSGIEHRDRAFIRRDQQADLGAAKDHPLRPAIGQLLDNAHVVVPRCVAEGAEAQLLKDNLIDARPICLVRDQALDAVLVRQPSAVEILFHSRAAPHGSCPLR